MILPLRIPSQRFFREEIMHSTSYVKAGAGLVIFLVLCGIGWQTRESWTGWLIPAKAGDKKDPGSENPDRVKLSEQAQRNLRLIVKKTPLTTYWRKIYLPGTVVDKPGHSDRGIPAPIAGVITNVYAVPGKTVHAGDELFLLRLVSESFQTSQMELFKSTRELEIVQKERKRLESIPAGAVPATKFLELEYQRDRLKVLIQAHRQDLQTRQLTAPQIADIENGKFVTEIVIRMPDRLGKHHQHSSDPLPIPPRPPLSKGGQGGGTSTNDGDPLPVPIAQPVEYEVQELKVNLGDHVQAGQMLAYLADHRYLYIEGRALKQEVRQLAQAAKEGWPVEAEFSDDDDASGDRLTDLSIEFLGNTMDAAGLTLPVYVPFANPQREYVRQGRTYHTGNYRPGQKVLLKVAVAQMPDVFVLPTAAVVREGADAYVFRQNGSSFDRKAVHVLLEDTDVVVIENDGSIIPGNYIAHNAAVALNRALKASQAEGGGGGHDHHNH
jgi:cobalt-zinc-cadmium efflux system membrane fusion protein